VRARGNEPRFGNLIPEFERCVAEARPEWFLMENVPAAPTPDVVGYGVAAFLLEHDGLDAGDGYGHEQMRTRRFSFGLRDAAAPDLRRWLQLAALKLPKAAPTVIGHGGATPYQRDGDRGRVRTQAVTGGRAAVEVAIGGSGNRKPGARVPTVVGGHSGITAESERRRRVNAVCGGHGKSLQAVAGGGGFKRYSYKEACRLQGLPEDFLADSPFLKDAKRDMVAAGVPLPMGRAIARAVNAALAAAAERTA
jgi:site-specific DNA-cytosine methylase